MGKNNDNTSMRAPQYWRAVLSDTFKETTFLAINKMLIGLVTAMLAFYFQFKFGLRPWSDAVKIIATVIVSYLIVCIAAFLMNLVRVPALLYSKQETRIATLQQELDQEISKHSRPAFTGEIRELYLESNWGGLPPECYCAVVLRTYLVNHSAPANIKDYKLFVEKENKTYDSTGLINANRHWQLAKKRTRALPSGGIAEKMGYEDLLDLSMRIGTMPLPQGRGEDGWLGFCMGDTDPGELDGGTFTLIVVDAYGGEHRISSSGPLTKSGTLIERGV
jgi:hypothetical protein